MLVRPYTTYIEALQHHVWETKIVIALVVPVASDTQRLGGSVRVLQRPLVGRGHPLVDLA